MFKAIWLLTPSLIIFYAIPTAIQSSLISFNHRPGFLHWGRGPVEIRSHTSFSISMDSVIPDHTGQLANPVGFSLLAWFPLKLDYSSAMVGFLGVSGLGGNLWNIGGLRVVFLALLSERFLKGFL